MAEAAEAPVVICIGSDQFRSHTGKAWRLVSSGATIRVSDLRSGEVLGYVSRELPAALAGLEASLPDAGQADDSLGPEPPPEPPDGWIIREPEPDPLEAA
jgi:hypothetical protein